MTIDWDDYFYKVHIPGVLKYLAWRLSFIQPAKFPAQAPGFENKTAILLHNSHASAFENKDCDSYYTTPEYAYINNCPRYNCKCLKMYLNYCFAMLHLYHGCKYKRSNMSRLLLILSWRGRVYLISLSY
jgi:hypothetical protein